MRKWIVLLVVLGTLFTFALPTFAAQGATITNITFDSANCLLTVTVVVQDAGDYYVQIWDDGANEGSLGGALPAGATATYTFTVGPVGQDATGIGIYVSNNPSNLSPKYSEVDPYDDAGLGLCSGGSWTGVGSGFVGSAATTSCARPIPAGFRVRSIPAGALAFFAADASTYTGFNLPAGQTWYSGNESGGFTQVWIACGANLVWVYTDNVVN